MDISKINPSRDLVQAIYLGAASLPDSTEREAYLKSACGNNHQLRTQIEEMLVTQAAAEHFFAKGVQAIGQLEIEELDVKVVEPKFAELNENQKIEGFKLLQKIGEGGCGVVYMAEQEKPIRRRVAIKVIKLGMDTKSVIARFEAERQALAMMDHPNIAHVFEAGTTSTGRPYFVMELVKGIRITDYCDENQLDTRERLELFFQVCSAIQHAHQKRIIHRDIKPSNILVTLHDGNPIPKVIDFGIAKAIEGKLTDQTLFTSYEHFIGTPAYMSPEQAAISALDVDTRSDIYSLGVLLYELLTGRTPFETNELLKKGLDAWRQTLRDKDPQRPSVLVTALRGSERQMIAGRRHADVHHLISILKNDLDWIVMKAMEKDRQRRYETANGFAMDIRRYLSNEPVVARPPSRLYRLQKLLQRNWVVFAASGAVVVTLIVGLAISTAMFYKARESERRQVELRELAEQAQASEMALRQEAEVRAKISEAALLASQGNYEKAAQLMGDVPELPPKLSLDSVTAFRSMGEYLARQGQWQQAGKYFWALMEIDKFDDWDVVTLDYQSCGVVMAQGGDTVSYERFRQMAVTGFSNTTNADAAGRILKTCLFQPINADTLKMLMPLGDTVEKWFATQDLKTINQWMIVPVSLWKFRCGDNAAAFDCCRAKLDDKDVVPSCLASIRLIMAMIYQQQGATDRAKAQFDLARSAIVAAFQPELHHGDRTVGMWYDWVADKILLREAAAKLGVPDENVEQIKY